MVFSENSDVSGVIKEDVTICNGATVSLGGVIEGDLCVMENSSAFVGSVILGRVTVEDGSSLEISGIVCEDNYRLAENVLVTGRVVPSGYSIVTDGD